MPKFPWPARDFDVELKPNCEGCTFPITKGQSITYYDLVGTRLKSRPIIWHSWCYMEYTTKGKGLTHGSNLS